MPGAKSSRLLEAAMRLFVLILASLAFAAPAAAQSWQEYSYPDYSFSVSFPAAPLVDTATYPVTGDRTVSARVYTVHRDDAEFRVTVADLGDPRPEEAALIDHAINMLSAGGEVKVNIPHRINRVYGRQLSIVQADGSRTSVALFDYDGRLYQIEGKSLPGGNATADVIRFVQSLAFTGGGSNRSADELRAGRAGCNEQAARESASPPSGDAAAAVPEDRRRFELRCRRQQLFAALRSSLNAGDLPGARQAYASLGELPRPGNANGPFVQAMDEVGQALNNGDVAAAQQALSSLRPGRGDRQR
jgi:hypothetical protein